MYVFSSKIMTLQPVSDGLHHLPQMSSTNVVLFVYIFVYNFVRFCFQKKCGKVWIFLKKSLSSPSAQGGFCEMSRCFLQCLQVSSNSSCLFNIECWLSLKITSFSVIHKSQAFPTLLNAWPLELIDHLISNCEPLSFNFQI